MLIAASSVYSQQQTVSGQVVGAGGAPLAGSIVSVDGTNRGTTTDAQGRFEIRARPDETLTISYVGYLNSQMPASQVSGGAVRLAEDHGKIDEVVVVGYGTQRRIDLSGAVASLNTEQATTDRMAVDLAAVLQGKISGVKVVSTEGMPGASGGITIRGTTSLNIDSQPLFVVDGVIVDNPMVSPADMESIDILKDAASTAIYGSRGANGVVLITTKKGKRDTPTIDIYAMTGVQYMAKKVPMMNSREIVSKNYFRNFDYRPAGTDMTSIPTNGDSAYQIFQDEEGNFYTVNKRASYTPEYYRTKPLYYNTDWQGAMTQVAPIQDYRINISGGTGRSQYAVMFSTQDQKGIMINTGNNVKSARVNLTQELKPWMDLSTNLSYSRTATFGNGGSRNGGIIGNMMRGNPVYPKYFGMDFQTPDGAPMLNLSNPVLMAESMTRDRRLQGAQGSASLNIRPIKNLTVNLSGSYNTNLEEIQIYYPSVIDFANAARGIGRNEKGWNESVSSENTATYRFEQLPEVHKLSAMAGMSVRSTESQNINIENDQFQQEDLGYWGINSGINPQPPAISQSHRNETSWFGRVNYIYDNRYIFQATARADASSVFAANNKWGYFPSASAAWRVSQERFMKGASSWLSNLKLRASWGISGKQLGPYASLAAVSTGITNYDGYTTTMASWFSSIENPNLKWERTREYNAGLDLSVLKDRIGLTVDVYDKTTKDLLYADPTPEYSGLQSQTRNVGSINNRGIELTLNLVPVKTHDWTWTVDFNISRNVSKILNIGIQDWKGISTGWNGSVDDGYLQVGKPIGQWYGLVFQGVWQTQAEIDHAVIEGVLDPSFQVKPGQGKYYDRNGDGRITSDDRLVIGCAEPKFIGGLTTAVRWKDLTLTATFAYSYGNDIFNGSSYYLEGTQGTNNAYAWTAGQEWMPRLYHWDKVTGRGDLFHAGNASTTLPFSNNQITPVSLPVSSWIEDGSYLRLADISLSYNLPKKWVNKVSIRNVKVFVSGNNVFCWTNYSGYDPDVNVSNGMAAYLMPGLDFYSYPRARTFMGGINITF
ncbi:SusC/RagA family TonB-linked outer membrane protein [Bacteroidia bacterium]|nr:SusC/RagA family TonB-linked outer membrane protein [Bacteroidia bacterium]